MVRVLTPLGAQFMAELPVQFADDPDVTAVQHVFAREFERMEEKRNALAAGLASPVRADERLLPVWERLLGLPVAPAGLTVEARQAAAGSFLERVRAGGTGAAWVAAVDRLVEGYRLNRLVDAGFEEGEDGGSSAWAVPPVAGYDPAVYGEATRALYLESIGWSALQVVPLAESWQETPGHALSLSSTEADPYVEQGPVGGWPVLPGISYRVKFAKKVTAQNNFGKLIMMLVWRDVSNATITSSSFGGGAGENTLGVHVIDGTAVAPAGAVTCRVLLQAASAAGVGSAISGYVDDIDFRFVGGWSYREYVSPENRRQNRVFDPKPKGAAGVNYTLHPNAQFPTPSMATMTKTAVTADPDFGPSGNALRIDIGASAGLSQFELFESTDNEGLLEADKWYGMRMRVRIDIAVASANGELVASVTSRVAAGGALSVYTPSGVHSNRLSTYAAGSVIELVGKFKTGATPIVSFRFGASVYGNGTPITTAQRYTVGRFMVAPLKGETSEVPEWFDGDGGLDVWGTEWLGTVDNSVSQEYTVLPGVVKVRVPFAVASVEFAQISRFLGLISDAHLQIGVNAG